RRLNLDAAKRSSRMRFARRSHRVLDGGLLTSLSGDLGGVIPVADQRHADFMFAWREIEVLAWSVEAVRVPGVLAVDIDAGIVRLDLCLEDSRVGRAADGAIASHSRSDRTQQQSREEQSRRPGTET